MNNLAKTDPKTLLADPNRCIEILVDALSSGSLNLIIGAGISISTKKNGFPNWIELTKNCCLKTKLGDFDPSRSGENKYLLSKLEQVRTQCQNTNLNFNDIVKECLYQDIKYNLKTLKVDLLIAIGALVMNSSKSSLANVINYNFDDMLEWYLTYYGFDIQVISGVKQLINSSDVVIYHPHGFLPATDRFEKFTSEKIILSQRDYVEASGFGDFWNSIQHTILSCKINLFIGMSGEDSHLETLCQFCYDKIIDKNRILGIMVLNKNQRTEIIENQNLKNGIITYYISDYSKLPELLLSITRKARGID